MSLFVWIIAAISFNVLFFEYMRKLILFSQAIFNTQFRILLLSTEMKHFQLI